MHFSLSKFVRVAIAVLTTLSLVGVGVIAHAQPATAAGVLQISQSASPSKVVRGGVERYTIRVKNPTGTAFNGVALSDNLTNILDDATYNNDATAKSSGSATPAAPTLSGGNLLLWNGNVQANAIVTITFSVTVNKIGDGLLNNRVNTTGTQSNCDTGSSDAACTANVSIGVANCPDLAYLSQGTSPAAVNLNTFDLATGTITPIANTTVGINTSIGVSEIDGKVYGVGVAGSNLYQYNAPDPGFSTIPIKPNPSNGNAFPAGPDYINAAASLDGSLLYLYGTGDNKLVMINIDSGSADFGAYVGQIPVAQPRTVADLAFNPKDGLLYGIDSSGNLIRMNPTTGGSAVLKSMQTVSNTSYGAAYFDNSGNMYVARNNNGNIYQIDLSASSPSAPIAGSAVPALRVVKTGGPILSFNDGAGCLAAHDFGDAPDSYGTLVTSNGASSQIDPSLSLGANESSEVDARIGAGGTLDGTGDTFDDGITGTLPVASTLSTGYRLNVAVKNTTGATATLAGWIDFNGNGIFDPGERSVVTSVPNGATSMALDWTGLTTPGLAGNSFVRLRLYSGTQANPQPTGAFAGAGEVEDYPVTIQAAALNFFKSVSNSNPHPGDTITYTVTATNNGTAAITGATFTDNLSDVIDDATYNNDATDHGFGGTFTPSATSVIWTGNIPANTTATVSYTVTIHNPPTGNKLLVNAVISTTPGSDCPVGNTDPRCTTTTGITLLSIAKSVSPTSVHAGGNVAYTVVLTNAGTAAYLGAAINDNLTNVLDDATYAGDATSTAGNAPVFNLGAKTLTWNGDVPQAGTVTITYSFNINNPLTGNGTLTNVVIGPADSNCPTGGNAAACTTTITGIATLQINKTVDNPTPKAGDTVGYIITLSNNGSAPYVGANVNDFLVGVLDDATYNNDASDHGAGGTFATPPAPPISWTGTVPQTGTVVLTFSVTVNNPPTGNKILHNIVIGPDGSNCPVGNTDPACNVDTPIALLHIVKTATPVGLFLGGRLSFTITLTNPGTANYTGATFNDNLSDVIDDASFPTDQTDNGAGGAFSTTTNALSWTGNVPAGGTVIINYSVVVNNPTTGNKVLQNGVVSTPDTNCPPANTNPDCRVNPPVGIPQLVINKAASATVVLAGDTVTYTVTAHNIGTGIYPAAPITDNLSDVVDDATYNNDATASAGNAPVFDSAAKTLTWTGDIAPNQTITITYSVKVNTPPMGNKILTNAIVGPEGSNCQVGTTPADPACSPPPIPVQSLQLFKSISNTAPVPGDTVIFTITATNTGATTYTGASFTDDLSGDLDDATYNNDAAATSGIIGYSAPTLTWTGNLVPGAAASVTYSMKVNDPVTGNGILDNFVVSSDPGNNCLPGSLDRSCVVSNPIAQVLGEVVTNNEGTTATPETLGTLAFTGAAHLPLLGSIGLGLLTLGGLMVFAGWPSFGSSRRALTRK